MARAIDPQRLADAASARFRIPFVASAKGASAVVLRLRDLTAPNGFSVDVRAAWRTLETVFIPDNYAGALLTSMAAASAQQRGLFCSIARLMTDRGIRLAMRVNDIGVDPTRELPEKPWERVELTASRLSAAVVEDDVGVFEVQVHDQALTFLSLVVALLPVEDSTDSEALFEGGLPEGAKVRLEVNRYERSPANRAACIAAYGDSCQACGFSFRSAYGILGEGYIEVHHVTPVSQMGGSYTVNPLTDLIPLCANCHAMVHRQDPPLSLGELRSLLVERRME